MYARQLAANLLKSAFGNEVLCDRPCWAELNVFIIIMARPLPPYFHGRADAAAFQTTCDCTQASHSVIAAEISLN